jgi:hypothetical protein
LQAPVADGYVALSIPHERFGFLTVLASDP